jgi:hypothetical protein
LPLPLVRLDLVRKKMLLNNVGDDVGAARIKFGGFRQDVFASLLWRDGVKH